MVVGPHRLPSETPVAYRPADGGIEVLAVGFEETLKYELSPEDGVKVVQP